MFRAQRNRVRTNYPRQTQTTEQLLQEMFAKQEQRLENILVQHLEKRMNSFCDQLFSKVEQTVQVVTTQVENLQRKTTNLEESYYDLCAHNKSVNQNVSYLEEKMMNLLAELDDKIDRLEGFSRRDNLKFFNVPVSPNETYEMCSKKIIDILQETLPFKRWSPDDVIRAHRLGSVNSGLSDRPPPLIVKFAKWADKMNILTKGREKLRQKGIGVAGDLTTRQQNIIKDYRDRGQHAYFKGMKLIVAGPLQTRPRNPDGHGSYAEVVRHNTQHADRTDSANRQQRDQRHYPVSQPTRNAESPSLRHPSNMPASQTTELDATPQFDSDELISEEDISLPTPTTPAMDSNATPQPPPPPRQKVCQRNGTEKVRNIQDLSSSVFDDINEKQTTVPDPDTASKRKDNQTGNKQKVSAKGKVLTRSQSVSNERAQQSRLPSDWVSRSTGATDAPSPSPAMNTNKNSKTPDRKK